MKKIFAFSLLLCAFCFQTSKAQEKMKDPSPSANTEYTENFIYKSLEKMPEYPGGISEFGKYVMANFSFPEELTQSIRFNISFVVEKDGSLSNVRLLNDPGFGIADQIKRIFASSPKWKPGYYDGNPVRTSFQFPIALQFE